MRCLVSQSLPRDSCSSPGSRAARPAAPRRTGRPRRATGSARSPSPSARTTPSWLQNIIAGWNQGHPDQKVTLLLLPEAANDQLAQLVANLQAKSDLYDVIDMDVIWTAEFASNGWIIPLPQGQFPLGDFLKPAVDTAMYQGRLYAVPDYSNADLLYYRKDILAKAGKQPPRTWAQLQQLARTVAPKYGLYGYAGTFAQYEGLTVNFAAAVQSAGGSILSPEGTRVTVNSAPALQGLEFLVGGFQQGWIPQVALTYEEESAQDAFADGRFLFLANWPDVYAALSRRARGTRCTGSSASRRCPARTAWAPARSAGPTSRSARIPSTSGRHSTSSST